MEANRKRKRNLASTQKPALDPVLEARILEAEFQCYRLIGFLVACAERGDSCFVIDILERTAAELEAVTNLPRFPESFNTAFESLIPGKPPIILPVQKPRPIYTQQARPAKPRFPSESCKGGSLRIETPTVAQLQTLFDLPSEPPTASQISSPLS
jgi:hypothetical protein